MLRGEGLRIVEMCKHRVGILYQCPLLMVMVLNILLEQIVCLPLR